MNRIETDLPGVFLLQPKVWGDARGFFMETYSAAKLCGTGYHQPFRAGQSFAQCQRHLRGLHLQRTFPQAKLCRVVRGRVLDIAVDVRPSSPHFGRWVSAELSEENKTQIFVPRGFAHGFVVLSDEAEFLYKCDEVYHPEDECGMAWNDPKSASTGN
jgi:dTDP-4-dehydrorhamnose 3,5-epimerase